MSASYPSVTAWGRLSSNITVVIFFEGNDITSKKDLVNFLTFVTSVIF